MESNNSITASKLFTMSPTLNCLSCILSMIAMVFYVIGSVSYSSNHEVVKNVAWITAEQSGVNIFYALKDVLIKGHGQVQEQSYSDCSNNNGNACDNCETDGKNAFVLCIVGAVVALCTMSLCGALTSRTVSFSMQVVSIITAAAGCAAGVIALNLFMGDCYDQLDDQTTIDLEWGPGAMLVAAAMFMMAVVGVIQILSTFICVSK